MKMKKEPTDRDGFGKIDRVLLKERLRNEGITPFRL
jgi:hypothetical protein